MSGFNKKIHVLFDTLVLPAIHEQETIQFQVQLTLDNSNLPLTRSNFRFP